MIVVAVISFLAGAVACYLVLRNNPQIEEKVDEKVDEIEDKLDKK